MKPFHLFFSLGILFGLWGVGVWVAFGLKLTQNYPGAVHSDAMIGGLLFSFAAGFLMTALPQSKAEILSVCLMIICTFASSVGTFFHPDLKKIETFFLFFNWIVITFLISRRFLRRTGQTLPPIAFLLIGLLCAVMGTGLLFYAEISDGVVNEVIPGLGKALFYYGMPLALILGIGTRVIPIFMGWPETLQTQWGMALLFLGSFPVEFLVNVTFGRSLRALIATVILARGWRLFQRPPQRGIVSHFFQFSGWLMINGVWLYALVPAWAIHGAHLYFIDGLIIVLLMAATRLISFEYESGLDKENTSIALKISGFCITIAAAFRFFAGLSSVLFVPFLALAGFFLMLALFTWLFSFSLIRLTVPSNSH
jgi:hypothetical protein